MPIPCLPLTSWWCTPWGFTRHCTNNHPRHRPPTLTSAYTTVPCHHLSWQLGALTLSSPIRYAHTQHHALRALGIMQYKHFRIISTLQHCICRNKLSKGDIHHPKTDIISASGLISSLHNKLCRLWFRAPLNTPSLELWDPLKVSSLTLPDFFFGCRSPAIPCLFSCIVCTPPCRMVPSVCSQARGDNRLR